MLRNDRRWSIVPVVVVGDVDPETVVRRRGRRHRPARPARRARAQPPRPPPRAPVAGGHRPAHRPAQPPHVHRRAQPPDPPRPSASTGPSASSRSTSTTSRRSTTPTATSPATRSCGGSASCSSARSAARTSSPAGAARSSSSGCSASTATARSTASPTCSAASAPRSSRTPDGEGFSLTFSAGVAQYPADGADLESLYDAADQALYAAKRNGRDQVAGAGTGTHGHPAGRRRRHRGRGRHLRAVRPTLNGRGLRCWRFSNGAGAVAMLLGERPRVRARVVILDLNLPAVDGMELLTLFSREGMLRGSRVIIASADERRGDASTRARSSARSTTWSSRSTSRR